MKNKVLIIDDDSRNIFALSAILKTKSFICYTEQDSLVAVELLKSDLEIDAILLDMMMPEMDGYDMIPVIKTIAHRRDTPIIAVTAQAMVGDKEKCLAAGADDYISKPIDFDKLLQVLTNL
tara:strand:- start:1061 stop:1423 length:363 start_codon:yes stop_codon:yes gene_type:complete